MDIAINYATLARDLDDSLIEKPIIELFDEFSDEEIIKREKDVFGFYLSNHPVSKYKVRYNNIVNFSKQKGLNLNNESKSRKGRE